MLLLIARSPSSVGSLYEPYLQKLLPPLRPWNAHVPYGFLSLEHLKDILQEQMLVGPFAALVALVLLLVGGGRRLGREGVVLLAAGIPWWGAGLMINRQIGAARDWDLFAVGLLPWIFLVALMVARRIDQGITRPWAVAQGLLVGVSVFHLLGWVAVDTRADTSIDRFAALNAPQGSSVSPWARSYAYEELGLYYLFAGDSEGAVAAFTESVLADSTNYRSAANLGRAFLNVGRADAAVQVLELTQTRNPFGAEIAFELGRAYAVKGWLVEARESHRRAIANRPDYLEAYINLASVEQRLGDLVQARSTLIEARRRWPDSALVHAQLGRVEVDIGNTEAAFASFARALELDPNDTPTLFNRGLLYRKGRDTEAAVRDFKALIALDPTDYEARINLAATYEEAGRVDEAAGVYAKAQDLQPERAEAYFYLARFHLGRQDTTAAREVLSRYVARDSTSNNGLAATRLLRILEGVTGAHDRPRDLPPRPAPYRGVGRSVCRGSWAFGQLHSAGHRPGDGHRRPVRYLPVVALVHPARRGGVWGGRRGLAGGGRGPRVRCLPVGYDRHVYRGTGGRGPGHRLDSPVGLGDRRVCRCVRRGLSR